MPIKKFSNRFPPKNRPSNELHYLDIQVEDAFTVRSMNPNEAAMMAHQGSLLLEDPVPGRVSDISGEPGYIYRTNEIELCLTKDELSALMRHRLDKRQYSALVQRFGVFFEIHCDFYDESDYEAVPSPFEVSNNEMQSYQLDQTNSWGAQDRKYRIIVVEDASAEAKAARLTQHSRTVYRDFVEARAEVRQRLMNRQEAIRVELKQLEYNLMHLNDLHPMPVDLGQVFQAKFDKLVEELKAIAQKPGGFELEGLTVTNTYVSALKTLFVFSLDEYGPCPQTFSGALCDLVVKAVEAAGLTIFGQWNGLGSFSFSIQVQPPQEAST